MENNNHPLLKFKYCPSCGSKNFKILSKLKKNVKIVILLIPIKYQEELQ